MYDYKKRKSHTVRNIFIIILLVAIGFGAVKFLKPDIFENISSEKIVKEENGVKNSKSVKTDPISQTYQTSYLGESFATLEEGDKSRELKLDIIRPASGGVVPAVIFIPGKNWLLEKETLESNGILTKLKEITNNGVAVIIPEYRDAAEAVFPAQIHDLKGAVRFVKANGGKYGINPDKISAVGEGTGGTLALLLGTTGGRNDFEGEIGGNKNFNSNIVSVAVLGPVTDLMNLSQDMNSKLMSRGDAEKRFDDKDSMEAKLIGFTGKSGTGMGAIRKLRKDRAVKNENWNKVHLTEMASPLYYVSEKTVPTLVIHGVNNVDSPLRQSLKFVEILMKNGVENIYISNSEGAAGYQGDEIATFINNWITKKSK